MPPANMAVKRQLRRQIRPFVENALKKGPLGLAADFRQMKQRDDPSPMSEFIAQEPNGKNRYKDIGCLDNNRVVLSIGPCSYIHANYVSTPNNPKRFICTQLSSCKLIPPDQYASQGPLPTTCSEFWHMIVQHEVEVIIMLCNFVEQTEQQYLYVHQVILNLLRVAGWLPRSLEPYLEMFSEQYLKLTK
ncbi:Protein-tyrosine phosphatase [Ancylostoma duodenale]|uniref:Protein-tyrosine phosphatase n=1 Tax=Ancylostoma duodenale TaxID=51022 RepID=A0A0C2GAM9_9BILA|nr:Protein-tyrosine phosphatase [Ancylostoma duodenale]